MKLNPEQFHDHLFNLFGKNKLDAIVCFALKGDDVSSVSALGGNPVGLQELRDSLYKCLKDVDEMLSDDDDDYDD